MPSAQKKKKESWIKKNFDSISSYLIFLQIYLVIWNNEHICSQEQVAMF